MSRAIIWLKELGRLEQYLMIRAIVSRTLVVLLMVGNVLSLIVWDILSVRSVVMSFQLNLSAKASFTDDA